MRIWKSIGLSLSLLIASNVGMSAAAGQRGKVLIVMSGAHQLELRDGKKYTTGYYLDELAVPLRRMIDAGYSPVFASPNGEAPSIDPSSNNAMFFEGKDTLLADALKLVHSRKDLEHPRSLAAVLAAGTTEYVGLFIPGGHAPMQDLLKDRDLGRILSAFHQTNRATGVICHGPVALLSAVPDPERFQQAMVAGDFDAAGKLAKGWPYAGYRLTVFSSAEEHKLEGAASQLGGSVLFYAADALAQAGAHVDHLALWQSNVVEDRELVSGQQPFSSDAVGAAFVAKLNATHP